MLTWSYYIESITWKQWDEPVFTVESDFERHALSIKNEVSYFGDVDTDEESKHAWLGCKVIGTCYIDNIPEGRL